MNNLQSSYSNEDARIDYFKKLMDPALHLFHAGVIDNLKYFGFFKAPASTKNHGNFEGGLFKHSCNVANVLVKLTKDNGLIGDRSESPYIVGMFHDLCKIDQYRHGPFGHYCEYEYNPETLLKGHGDKSVMLLSQYLQLTLEEILCIRYHMGAFVDENEWNDYTRAIKKYENVLWTHHADMIASCLIENKEEQK